MVRVPTYPRIPRETNRTAADRDLDLDHVTPDGLRDRITGLALHPEVDGAADRSDLRMMTHFRQGSTVIGRVCDGHVTDPPTKGEHPC
ncbi:MULTISPECIES: hypothetical protein [unclassified Streptomyces]|uniref:hypothetical protein n=1 Tax=unclassified Streptomyces TaxID=2593676 RepID=UPI0006AEB0B3|nr:MULTISPECIES: hypothetical protein [unclassified Streptomyces]